MQLPDRKNVNTEPYKLTAGMSQACSSAPAISDGYLVADWQINKVNIVQYWWLAKKYVNSSQTEMLMSPLILL